jgi:hypothetical protein
MRPGRLIQNAFFVIAIGSIAAAQSGGNYVIKDSTVEGSAHVSSGGVFVKEARLGQGLAGPSLAGGNYAVGGGFYTAPPAPPTLTAPAAPSNLVADAVSGSEIFLTWSDNASNEENFQLERCDGKGKCRMFTLLASPGVNAVSFMDTGLSPASQYSYRLRAVNSFGDSAYSNVAKARTSRR